jgi:hypothetical protein
MPGSSIFGSIPVRLLTADAVDLTEKLRQSLMLL